MNMLVLCYNTNFLFIYLESRQDSLNTQSMLRRTCLLQHNIKHALQKLIEVNNPNSTYAELYSIIYYAELFR